jgi:pilus assembly protein Flp/PilA
MKDWRNQMTMPQFVRSLLRDRRAVTALEYGLIASLIAVAIIAAVTTLGTNIGNTFNLIANQL